MPRASRSAPRSLLLLGLGPLPASAVTCADGRSLSRRAHPRGRFRRRDLGAGARRRGSPGGRGRPGAERAIPASRPELRSWRRRSGRRHSRRPRPTDMDIGVPWGRRLRSASTSAWRTPTSPPVGWRSWTGHRRAGPHRRGARHGGPRSRPGAGRAARRRPRRPRGHDHQGAGQGQRRPQALRPVRGMLQGPDELPLARHQQRGDGGGLGPGAERRDHDLRRR